MPSLGDHHVLVAIDGVDGAGKSTFAAELASALRATGRPVIEASIDGFHRPRAERYRRGRHSPRGFWLDSYDYDALRTELVEPLRPGGSGVYRTAVHDVSTDAVLDGPARTAVAGSVVVLDGIFLHRDQLRSLWDYSVFLDVPLGVAAQRLAQRDGGSPVGRNRYVGGQRLYLAACSPRQRASVVVDNTDLARPRIVGA